MIWLFLYLSYQKQAGAGLIMLIHVARSCNASVDSEYANDPLVSVMPISDVVDRKPLVDLLTY